MSHQGRDEHSERHTSYSPQQHARDQLQIVTCANKCTKRKRKTTGALIRPPMAARQRLLCVGSVVLSVRWRVAGAVSAEGGADELESNRIKSKRVRYAAVPGPRVDPVNCFLGSKGCFLGSKEKHSARALSGSFVSWGPFFDMYGAQETNFSIFVERVDRFVSCLSVERVPRAQETERRFLGSDMLLICCPQETCASLPKSFDMTCHVS